MPSASVSLNWARLSGAAGAVVDERHERVTAVGPLPGRGRVLLLGVGGNQHSVEVDGHRPIRVGRRLAGQPPDPLTGLSPRGTDRLQGLLPGDGEGVDKAGDRRVGGDGPEHGRLGPQHGDVRETVSARRDRQRDVQEHLPGIVNGPRLPPRRQRRGYRPVKAALADCLHEQNRAGLGDHLAAVPLDTDTRIRRGRLSHLESGAVVGHGFAVQFLLLGECGGVPGEPAGDLPHRR